MPLIGLCDWPLSRTQSKMICLSSCCSDVVSISAFTITAFAHVHVCSNPGTVTCSPVSDLVYTDTAEPLKGLFTLLRVFEAISESELQREILVHSLQLRSLSQGSKVQLLRHGVESAGELMEVLRQHAPKGSTDDHLLVMQGPEHDIVS